ARARVQRTGRAADLPARAADRALVPARRPAAAATAPGPPGAVVRDVPDAAPHVGDGDVRVRVSVVPDGGAARRDLARLPQGARARGAVQRRYHADLLPRV